MIGKSFAAVTGRVLVLATFATGCTGQSPTQPSTSIGNLCRAMDRPDSWPVWSWGPDFTYT